ncbi:MAG: polyprenol monophosphomannose synthase [Candidatus Magasanikbacteria bacterium]
MKPIVVIPTYNESENISKLIEQIFFQKIENLELIIIDDNSPDKTAEIVKKLQEIYPIQLIQRASKLGLGSALVAGFLEAISRGADIIIEMDADFSHDPIDIARLIDATARGADLVIGSRKIAGGKIIGWNWWRHFESNGAMYFSRLMLGLNAHDVTAGFRCFKSPILQKINIDKIQSNGYAFQEEVLYRVSRSGCKIVEIPVIFRDRTLGQSKLSRKDVLEFFKIIFKLKFNL